MPALCAKYNLLSYVSHQYNLISVPYTTKGNNRRFDMELQKNGFTAMGNILIAHISAAYPSPVIYTKL